MATKIKYLLPLNLGLLGFSIFLSFFEHSTGKENSLQKAVKVKNFNFAVGDLVSTSKISSLRESEEKKSIFLTLKIFADKQYDYDQNISLAEGNVKALINGGILRSDLLSYDKSTGILSASGNIRFTKGGQYFIAKEFEFNLLTKDGIIIDTYGILDVENVLNDLKIDNNSNSNIKYCFNNINQYTDSVSEIFLLSSGSKFIKNEINCNLNGKYASAFVNGVFILNETKHHEIKTNINHIIENTKSYQLIKGVLEDTSKAVYQGKIFVDSKAQKTDGYQLSKAILLNDNTEFNAKPELEIYADDVKCSHGSASGSLNEDSIFYLMSRGLNYQEAKKLLINGFLLDVIEKITDTEIRNLIKNIMNLKQ